MPGRYHAEIRMGTPGSPERHEFAAVDAGDPPSEEAMRKLRRLHAGAVTVVTTTDAQGYRGITVTAFCIASLTPPRVLISLATANETLAIILTARRFAVSILSDTQEFLAERFAGHAPLVNSRFAGVKHRLSRGGNPVLEECLAWYDCVVDGQSVLGDHTVVFGDVAEAGFGNGSEALLYYDGAYRFLQIG